MGKRRKNIGADDKNQKDSLRKPVGIDTIFKNNDDHQRDHRDLGNRKSQEVLCLQNSQNLRH